LTRKFDSRRTVIDRGADIGFLSQYPHEREMLCACVPSGPTRGVSLNVIILGRPPRCRFNPLTGLEVQSTRIEGAVMVVSVKLSVNLTSLTIEQVIGKRKKMLNDMVPGLRGELRADLATMNGEGRDFLLGSLEASPQGLAPHPPQDPTRHPPQPPCRSARGAA
jgi:hypothetical protein